MPSMIDRLDNRYFEDKKVSISIMSTFIILIIQYFILYYFKIVNTRTGEIVQLLCKISTGLCFLYSLKYVLKRNSIMVIGIYSTLTCVLLLNYLFFEKNRVYLLSILIDLLLLSLPCFVYSFSINDIKIFNFITEKASYIIYVIGIIIGLLVFFNRISLGPYSMSLSYYLLLPTLIYLYKFFEKVSILSAVLAVISMVVMVAIGSRGAIMAAGVYILLYQIINIKRINRRRLLANIILLLSLTIGTLYYYNLTLLLLKVFDAFGISSRSLMLFLYDPIHMSGRDIIYKEILYQIDMHFISGIGIAGDRAYSGGLYSHNIVLEIISGFGIIIGGTIIILLLMVILKALVSKDIRGSNIMLIWFAVGIVPLMVSGSYLTDHQFWIFLGIAIRFIRDLKHNQENNSLINYNYLQKDCVKDP